VGLGYIVRVREDDKLFSVCVEEHGYTERT
jgi:hypothetical protein